MVDHYLQRQILEKLAFADRLRFSELLPPEIGNNAFNYHLKQLLGQGLVTKTADGYQLTATGLDYVDRLSLDLHRPRQQPKLVLWLALRRSNGDWLLARRLTQPDVGRVGLVTGKRHLGESSVEQQRREASQQLGIDLSAELRGWADVRLRSKDRLGHFVGPVYRADYEGEAPKPSRKYQYFWGRAEMADLAGSRQILDRLDDGGGLFEVSLDLTAD